MSDPQSQDPMMNNQMIHQQSQAAQNQLQMQLLQQQQQHQQQLPLNANQQAIQLAIQQQQQQQQQMQLQHAQLFMAQQAQQQDAIYMHAQNQALQTPGQSDFAHPGHQAHLTHPVHPSHPSHPHGHQVLHGHPPGAILHAQQQQQQHPHIPVQIQIPHPQIHGQINAPGQHPQMQQMYTSTNVPAGVHPQMHQQQIHQQMHPQMSIQIPQHAGHQLGHPLAHAQAQAHAQGLLLNQGVQVAPGATTPGTAVFTSSINGIPTTPTTPGIPGVSPYGAAVSASAIEANASNATHLNLSSRKSESKRSKSTQANPSSIAANVTTPTAPPAGTSASTFHYQSKPVPTLGHGLLPCVQPYNHIHAVPPPQSASASANNPSAMNLLQSTEVEEGSYIGRDLRPSVKALLRRKVWSHGHEAMLVESINWAAKDKPRNLWTRIRKDPRYFAVLGHYNGAEMNTKWTTLAESDPILGPIHKQNPNALRIDPLDPKGAERELEIAKAPIFAEQFVLRSSDGERLYHTPLESLPIGASGALLPPLYGPEYGACDSDSDDESIFYASNPAVKAAVVTIATGMSPSGTDSATNTTATPEEISTAKTVVESLSNRERVHELFTLAWDQYTSTPAAKYRELCAEESAERFINSFDSHEEQIHHRQRLLQEKLAKEEEKKKTLLHNCVIYLHCRNCLLELEQEIHAPAVLEASSCGPTLITVRYPIKSLKTFLVSQCGMNVGDVLQLIRQLVLTPSCEKRRNMLSTAIHQLYNTSNFARAHFRADIRGGTKQRSLAPVFVSVEGTLQKAIYDAQQKANFAPDVIQQKKIQQQQVLQQQQSKFLYSN